MKALCWLLLLCLLTGALLSACGPLVGLYLLQVPAPSATPSPATSPAPEA